MKSLLKTLLASTLLLLALAPPSRAQIYLFWLDSPTGRTNPNDPRSPLHHKNTATATPFVLPTLNPTLTASPSSVASATPTLTIDASATYSSTGTGTSSPTNMATATQTWTATAMPTGTLTATLTATGTYTASPTPTFTASPTATSTASPTRTFTGSPTSTFTTPPTATRTASPTNTVADSPTATRSNTGTSTSTVPSTPSLTATPTTSFSASPTSSLTRTSTYTETPSPSGTPGASSTPTFTGSPSGTPSYTASPSLTRTATPTRSATPTSTATASPTSTATGTATASPSLTSTGTRTASPSPSGTLGASNTPSFTVTGTSTASFTATRTATPTATFTASPTRTFTATPTATSTPTLASSFTATGTATRTPTLSFTASPSASFTGTPSRTPTPTFSSSPTPTFTGSPTRSATPTSTSTSTLASSFTLTPSRTSTPTSTNSPTATFTGSPTRTATPTPTFTASGTPTTAITPTATPVQLNTWRVNSGGPAYTDVHGNVWAADENYNGGTLSGTGNPISNTTDPALYQDERWGNYNYTFNVPAGSYQVTLLFAETYWTAAGDRVFNVSINGITVLSSFDIFLDSGGIDVADVKVFNNIAPSGGQIVITLGPASKDNATIDAIQIIPQPVATATPTISPTFTVSPTYTKTTTPGGSTPTTGPSATFTATQVCSPSLAVGATTNWVSYEGEAGTLGNGATVVAMTTPPTTQFSAPEIEASGRAFVKLQGNGQYVQWTNNTGQPINGINLRSSIPDAAGGGGLSSTIDLYVNGAFRQAFNVTSTQNYCYEGLNYNDQTDKNPADGDARFFWNDTHALVTGAPINPGDTFRFQMDTASNNAAWYEVDVVDVENVPPAITPPANSLSIATYGAQPNNISFDNTSAINNCFAAAITQGKVVWIPAGIWYFSAVNGGLGGYNASVSKGLTIEGAGPWYTTLYRVTPAGNTQGVANMVTTQNSTMENLALDCNANSRAGNNNNGACNFSGDNWKINNIWIQHVSSAFWCAGTNGVAENCRSQSIWSDGGNFNNVEDSRGLGQNLRYYNNFVRGAGDDSMAINSVNYNGTTTYTIMSNITYEFNTAIAPWGGKGIGIYGGNNIIVRNNLLVDTARYLGLGVMKFGVNGSDLHSATVMYNTVLRCGGNGYSQQQQAMMIGNGGDGQGVGTIENAYIEYNTITNALWDAVGFSSNGLNNTLQNNTINSPGLDGIAFGNQTKDLGTCTGDALLLNNTFNNIPSGRSALLTQSGYATYTPIMASTANTASGAASETCSEGGQDMGSISNGSYLEFNNVNLAGMVTFIARVASAGAGGNIEVRMDSPTGTLLGTSAVPVTGCWQTWTQTYTTLTGASGTHNLYLVFTGGAGNLFNFQWFALTTYGII